MMSARLKRFYALAVTLGLACVFLALSLVVPVVGTTTDFSIYNAGWNGTSDLAIKTYKAGQFVPTLELRGTEATMEPAIMALDRVELDPLTSSIVIIGPSKTFTKADGDYVSDFLEGGGTLLLADDFGSGNSLLAYLNTSSRFSNNLVIDLAFEKKPEFVVAYNFEDSKLTEDVDTILLNYPSSVKPSANAEVLATTSTASWMDLNDNMYKDDNEAGGPFPLLSIESIGKGTMILFADPSVLINSMYEQLDNSVLVDNLLAFVSEGRTDILIDESHRDFFDPLSFTSRVLIGIGEDAKLLLIIIIVVAFFLTTTDALSRTVRFILRSVTRIWNRILRVFVKEQEAATDTFMNDEEIVRRVMERHPDWNRGVLSHLLRQIERHGAVKK